jgi:hypothetical protein
MIVNISHVQGIHGEVKRILKDFISAQCCSMDACAAFVEYCKSIWTMQTAQFTKEKFEKLFNLHEEEDLNYGPIEDYPKWEDVEKCLAYFLEGWQQFVHAIVINSTPIGKEEQRLYSQDPEELAKGEVMELTDDHLWIVSGGNTIGRGLTLPGLTVSYFDRVRDSTCVDTLTQMGRWFGYRPGYELLPRVWMNPAAVGEMKRIAALELRMHASIAENFAQHYSPADPAHFQQIDCWSRDVSGRAFAFRTLDADIGTMASTKDFFLSAEKRSHIFEICEDFVSNKIGPAKTRNPGEYLYADTPLWENVDRNAVRSLIGSLLPHYPDESRKILRGIMRDISGSEPTGWDVVVGNPQASDEKKIVFGGHSVHFGTPSGLEIGGDVLRTAEVRLHISFYAMIRSEYIFREDLEILEQNKTVVADAIETIRAINGGVLPQHYETVLPGGDGDTILARLNLLIEEMKNDMAQPLPEAIHARLGDISQGFRNRSAREYMARVHVAAGHTRPVLQLYLFRPKGLTDDAKPMVAIAIYWPGHSPDGFFTICVDDSPAARAMVTPRVFCLNVEDILKERDFPVQRKELLRLTLERLGPRCNVNIFEQRIATPLAGFKYHKMQGRNAYCIDGWAGDEEQRLASELLQAAVSIIQRDKTPYTTEMILAQVIDEQPRFRDFFVPGTDNSFLNALMTDDILNANGITVTSHHPITYCYCN